MSRPPSIPSLAAACLASALSCVPQGSLLDTSFACEDGVQTRNPYDFTWRVRVVSAVLDLDASEDAQKSKGLLFESTSPDGAILRTQPVAPEMFGSEATLRWQQSQSFVIGGLDEVTAEDGSTGFDLALRSHYWAWWLIFPYRVREEHLSCSGLRFDGSALVDAHNRGARLQLVSDPADADAGAPFAIVPPSCSWLESVELEVEPEFDWERFAGEIGPSSGCNSLASADAYDYRVTLHRATLDDGILATAGLDQLRTRAEIRWAGLDPDADAGDDERYKSLVLQSAEPIIGDAEPAYELTVGAGSALPAQIDHLDGSIPEHRFRIRIFQDGSDFGLADCYLSLPESEILRSVNGRVGVVPGPLQLALAPGAGLTCTESGGLDLSAGAPMTVSFDAVLKSEIGGAEELDSPDQHSGASDPDEIVGGQALAEEEDGETGAGGKDSDSSKDEEEEDEGPGDEEPGAEEEPTCSANTAQDCCEAPDACCLPDFDVTSCEGEACSMTVEDCCVVPQLCCLEDFVEASDCSAGDPPVCSAEPTSCCNNEAIHCCEGISCDLDEQEEEDDSPPPIPPGTSEPDEAPDDETYPGSNRPAGCACNGSDGGSSPGSALLLLLALATLFRRRRPVGS